MSKTIQQLAIALAEYISDNDEAIDGYNRDPSPMESRNGFEWCAPAYLSLYNSTGTGTPWQDRIIERLEQAQADEWERQYPQRKGLMFCAYDESGEYTLEAQEWLDAALDDEAIYCGFEIFADGDDITIRAGFTDEINRPLAMEFNESIGVPEFLAMNDAALEALIARIADAIYTESPE